MAPAPILFEWDVTKEHLIRRGWPLLNKRSFHFQPMEGDSGVALRLNLQNRMRHRRNHRAGQTHAIELHHRPLLKEGFQFEHRRRIRGRFKHPDWQLTLDVWFI